MSVTESVLVWALITAVVVTCAFTVGTLAKRHRLNRIRQVGAGERPAPQLAMSRVEQEKLAQALETLRSQQRTNVPPPP